MGLGRVITDADRYVGMEGTNRGGARRQQRTAHRRFQIVGVGGDGHPSLLFESENSSNRRAYRSPEHIVGAPANT